MARNIEARREYLKCPETQKSKFLSETEINVKKNSFMKNMRLRVMPRQTEKHFPCCVPCFINSSNQ